jgi:hypothetical protein
MLDLRQHISFPYGIAIAPFYGLERTIISGTDSADPVWVNHNPSGKSAFFHQYAGLGMPHFDPQLMLECYRHNNISSVRIMIMNVRLVIMVFMPATRAMGFMVILKGLLQFMRVSFMPFRMFFVIIADHF